VYKSQVALVDEALADVKKKLEKQRVVEEQVSPGPSPTTKIYNAGVVKIYNASNSLGRFRVKIIFLRYKNAVAYYNPGVVVVNSKVVGLAPGLIWYLRCLLR
jgi:hypothetical protein